MDGLLDQIQGVPGRYGRRMQDRRVNGAVSGTLDTDFVLECSKRRLLKYCIRVSVRRDCIKTALNPRDCTLDLSSRMTVCT